MQLAKQWPEMVVKWPFVSCDFQGFFLTKLKKLEMASILFYIIVFDQMDYVIDGEIQGRSLVFLKAHCPCILPSLT